MESENKTKLQVALEKYVADINPMHLVIGTDTEYEYEVKLFLERARSLTDEDQLMKIIRQIFQEMFNVGKDDAFLAEYKQIIQEYLRLNRNGELSH